MHSSLKKRDENYSCLKSKERNAEIVLHSTYPSDDII